MMRKFIWFVLLGFCCTYICAQNRFIYIRYNPKYGNASAIVNAVDGMLQQAGGRSVIFVSQASTPVVATNAEEWQRARSGLLRMQTAYEYYPEEESAILNRFYSTLFHETVSPDLHLTSSGDGQWLCTYIVSEQATQSDEFDALAENIAVNELPRRMNVSVLTYNESQSLSTTDIPANKMFNFQY